MIVLFIVVFIIYRRRNLIIAKKAIERNKTEEKLKMIELAKRFIGKECIVTAFDSNHQFAGFIKEVSEGALLIEKDGQLEAINLDFVIRISEYPRNKKGKKKAVIIE